MENVSEVIQKEAAIEIHKQKDDEPPGLDDSCILQEPHITIIELNDTIVEKIPQEKEGSASEVTEETTTDIIKINNENDQLPHEFNGPIMKVVFYNEEHYNKYKKTVENFLSTALRTKNTLIEVVPNDAERSLEFSNRSGDGDEFIFSIDTTPAGNQSKQPFPSYSKYKFAKIGVKPQENTGVSKGRSMCFNCDGNHLLGECDQPRDFGKISRARNNFNTANPRVERYHTETQQR